MKRPHQVTAVLFFLVAVVFGRESLEMPFYMDDGPGPSFFPLLLSICLALLAAGMFYQASVRADPMPEDFLASKAGYLRIGGIVLSMALAAFLLEVLGFRLTTLLFLAFVLYVIGRQNVLVTALVSLAGSFGIYYLFVEWLKVVLPMGIFGI